MSPTSASQLEVLAGSIRQADGVEFWLIAAFALLAVVAAGFGAFLYLKRKRVIEDTPTALIRSAPQGYVELAGRADLLDGEPIIAPLTGKRCTWYHYQIEKRERHARRNQSSWHVVDRGTSEALFHVVDATGRCIVDPEGAEVITTHKNTWYGRTRPPGAPTRSLGSSFTGAYRFFEARIECGDPLYVIGNFATRGGAGTTVNKEADVRDLVREWKRDRHAMLANFDANGDGEIDMTEWRELTAAAERKIAAEHARASSAPSVDVVGATADSRHPFVISNIPERALRRVYQWKSAGLGICAVLGSLALFWAISIRLAS